MHALFEADERHALLPLPAERFPLFHETQRTVHRDGHIVIERAFYSVPPEFLGRPSSSQQRRSNSSSSTVIR
ncbi:MAG: hypothetical protein IPH13_11830 [Planctomycetes bacterium]|nr:hypothetical protein [Planctomycetota bacterium]